MVTSEVQGLEEKYQRSSDRIFTKIPEEKNIITVSIAIRMSCKSAIKMITSEVHGLEEIHQRRSESIFTKIPCINCSKNMANMMVKRNMSDAHMV